MLLVFSKKIEIKIDWGRLTGKSNSLMAHRIPIQSLYDILSKKYPQGINWYDMFIGNEKKIKYIGDTFLHTIKSFSQTKKIQKTFFAESEIPQVIYKNGEKYYKLPSEIKEKKFDLSWTGNIFYKYIIDLIKSDSIEKLCYIFENKIFDIKYFYGKPPYRNVEGIILDFIKYYLTEYLYFSLFLLDTNINIQIDKGTQPHYEDGKIIYKDVFKHNFNFPHQILNEHMGKILNNIIMNNKCSLVGTNIIQEKIKNNEWDQNFIKEYTKYCFKKIYHTYYLIANFGNIPDLDDWIKYRIRESIMSFFQFNR
jgi:hypothetical protein